jgi:gliding motility-associated lipoprotein GldH
MKDVFKGIIFLMVLVACDANRVFEEYKPLEQDGWDKDSVARFDVEVGGTAQKYNLYINIRNKGNYPYSNIWLFVDIKAPDGILLTDTVEYILAERSGKWLGSGIGDLFDNQFIYRRSVLFEKAGTYQFVIRQGMRAQKLEGIHDVGLRVETQN